MDHVRTVIPQGYYRAPDYRYREVTKWLQTDHGSAPTFPDRHQNYLVDFIRSDGTEEVVASVYEAVCLNAIPYARTVLSALLFSNTPIGEILSITEVEEDTVLAYRALFFETDVFRNRLLKNSFVQHLPAGTDDEQYYRDMLNWALKLGWEYVEWRVTGKNNSLSVAEMLKTLLADSMWRSREHIFSRLNDAAAQEARAWLPHTIRLADAVLEHNNDRIRSIDELRIELTGLDITTSRNKLGADIAIHSVSPQ